MAIISIENMKFYAYHGCFEQERVIGTNFLVSIYLQTDTSKAQQTDDILDTLDYSKAYAIVKEQMFIPSHLLEHVAQRIIQALKETFPQISHAKVKVSKLNPPVGGQMDSVNVEIEEPIRNTI